MAATGAEGEPDLTAMLDVVMQLLMYFIMCVRLGAEEVPIGTINLPNSQMARPLIKGEGEMLFINVLANGKLQVLGREPMTLGEMDIWLGNRAMESKGRSKTGKVDTAIALRADRGANYADVYRVMEKCKKHEFTKFKVRATAAGSGFGGGGH